MFIGERRLRVGCLVGASNCAPLGTVYSSGVAS
jgi:hypothetical protein